MKRLTALAIALIVTSAALAAAVVVTPYAYIELSAALARRGVTLAPKPADPGAFDAQPGPPAGTVMGGRWRVETIGRGVYALGEPADAPDNYEYLILGARRALLIDAGMTRQDMRPVLAGLTTLPVTVIPTHLHYDHTTGLANFGRAALVDLPATRALVRDGRARLGRYDASISPRGDPPAQFAVSEWVKPDSDIDLGGRAVQVLWTPGHTPTSVSLYLPDQAMLFTGDFLYPTTLYEFAPGASLAAYVRSADRLLRFLPPGTRLYGAHCCRNDAPPRAPWLSLQDLRDARDAVEQVRRFHATGGRGFVIRRYPVNARMTLLSLYPFGNW
jgi:glyoxylase-like metal-dependent hydrolase (beta-lactamase superfamily II)